MSRAVMREEIVQANRWSVSPGCRYRANHAVRRIPTTTAATTLVVIRIRSSAWPVVTPVRSVEFAWGSRFTSRAPRSVAGGPIVGPPPEPAGHRAHTYPGGARQNREGGSVAAAPRQGEGAADRLGEQSGGDDAQRGTGCPLAPRIPGPEDLLGLPPAVVACHENAFHHRGDIRSEVVERGRQGRRVETERRPEGPGVGHVPVSLGRRQWLYEVRVAFDPRPDDRGVCPPEEVGIVRSVRGAGGEGPGRGAQPPFDPGMEVPNVRGRAFGLLSIAEDDREVQTDRGCESLGGGPSTIGVLCYCCGDH